MIIYINRHKYDITEFIKEHPGGADVFKDGKDMTGEFNAVGHSKNAVKMLEQYLVEDNDAENTIKNGENNNSDNDINLDNVSMCDFACHKLKQNRITKLFTHEDKFNSHKLLGFFAVINFMYFFFDIYYSGFKGEMTLRKFDIRFVLSLIVLAILSLSSLQFKVPTNFNKVNFGMVKEYQLHAIIFSLRSIIIMLILYFVDNPWIKQILVILIIFATMFCADLVTKYTKDPNDILGSKVGNIPVWHDCPKILKDHIHKIYSFAQLFFTTWCFNPQAEIQFAAIFVIQITAFLTTLARKGIIGVKGWNILYLMEYAMIALGWSRNPQIYIQFVIGILMFILRTRINIKKYALWMGYTLCFLYAKYYDYDAKNTTILAVMLIMLYTVLHYNNRLFDPPRMPANNVVLENRTDNKDHHRFRFKMQKPVNNFKPGQYYNIYVGTEKRPYTPIYYDDSNLEFLIKRYNDGEISPKICDFFVKDSLVNIQGPFGNKYYDRTNDLLVIGGNDKVTQRVLMFCCGTGITPFYSILTNLAENTKYKFNIYASFRSKKENFLIDDIPDKAACNTCFYSEDNDRLTEDKVKEIAANHNESVILICGTDNYNKMIMGCLEGTHNVYIW